MGGAQVRSHKEGSGVQVPVKQVPLTDIAAGPLTVQRAKKAFFPLKLSDAAGRKSPSASTLAALQRQVSVACQRKRHLASACPVFFRLICGRAKRSVGQTKKKKKRKEQKN